MTFNFDGDRKSMPSPPKNAILLLDEEAGWLGKAEFDSGVHSLGCMGATTCISLLIHCPLLNRVGAYHITTGTTEQALRTFIDAVTTSELKDGEDCPEHDQALNNTDDDDGWEDDDDDDASDQDAGEEKQGEE